MRVQGVISLKEDQVNDLFGKLGTHSKCAGATLWLRDAFFADYRGRKVTISAPSRRVAACAIRTLLFQLSNKHGTDTALTTLSTWNYVDRKQQPHGPYPFHKMLHWAEQNAFHDESLPVQHSILQCWIPLWCLPLLNDLANNNANGAEPLNQPEEIAMEDWETTVRQLNEERSKGLLGSGGGGSTYISNFPELQVYNNEVDEIDSSSAAPMDYELSHAIQFDVAPDSVRAFIVVDTNILLSHMSFTERVFEKLASSGPHVEVLLLVPWIVINELDRLKDAGDGGRRGNTSDAARRALRRIRALTSDRDAFVHAQSAAEHEKVVLARDLPNASTVKLRELRNDDLILQTCLHWQRGVVASLRAAGHRASVFLLSNDKGLCTRAEANGVRCFSAMEFPGTVETLAAEVLVVEPVGMEEAAAVAATVAEEVEEKVAKIDMNEKKSTLTAVSTKIEGDSGQVGVVAASSLPLAPHPALLQKEEKDNEQIHNGSKSGVDPLHRLESLIERCLAPGIKYYRQQDLGDLWIEMLEERSRPPWRAATVIDVLCSHSTTFWEYLTRDELDQARELEKYLKRAHHHQHHRSSTSTTPRIFNGSLSENGGDKAHFIEEKLQNIMLKLLSGLEKSRQDGTDPPNPAEVPDFISLGDARGALREGVEELEQWLRERDPKDRSGSK